MLVPEFGACVSRVIDRPAVRLLGVSEVDLGT